MPSLSQALIFNITYQGGNSPYIGNNFLSLMCQCQAWEAEGSTILLRDTPWGCRGQYGTWFCTSTLFWRQDIPYQRFTGQVVSPFQTMSPGITLECCLLLSSTSGSLLPPFLSRLGITLSHAAYLFPDKLFSGAGTTPLSTLLCSQQ